MGSTMRKGTSVEVGTAGNEGMVGLPIVFGDQQSPMNVYMQVPGRGLRLKASTLSAELNRNTRLRTALLHYAHAFFNLGRTVGGLCSSSFLGTAMLPLAPYDP